MLREIVELVSAGGLVTAGALWQRWRMRSRDKKPKISAEVSQEIYDLYKRWAGFKKMTLSEFIRKTLAKAVPENATEMMDQAEGKSLDRAFAALDEQDALIGLQPEPKEKVNGVAHGRHLPVHPCLMLDPDNRPPNYRPGECQGVCKHTSQKGRVCLWPKQTAHNCPVFMRNHEFVATP
jgi:hypothetical protein